MTVRELVQVLMQHPLTMQVNVSPDTFNAWDSFSVKQLDVRGEQAVVIMAKKPVPPKADSKVA